MGKTVSVKTHLGPQSQDIIFASVVDAKSTTGEIKVSALKQYGLMQGPATGYEASTLAKSISNSPEDELTPLLGQAALHPAIFKSLFDTFHGDTVTRAKLRQRAADLQVHPEQTEQCIDLYVSALAFAGLASLDGDKVIHRSALPADTQEEPSDFSPDDSVTIIDSEASSSEEAQQSSENGDDIPNNATSPRAIFHVNVQLDASLDTEKLQRQLELLKRYGAI